MISWHRLFGLTLMDFFTGSNYEVELEKNLTVQEQYLDVIILRKSEGKPPTELPDGLDNLSQYNLISYKSLHEPLDGWVIDELVGYYTMYRKQVSPSLKQLLPIEQFQLYAVCTRYPHLLRRELKSKKVEKLASGIYEKWSGSRPIRIIVLSEISQNKRNALWQLFSGNAKGFSFGDKWYHWRKPRTQQLLNQFYELYQKEGFMSYTLDDYYREYTIPFIESLPPEIRLRGIPSEKLLERVPSEKRLEGIPPEKLLERVPLELLKEYLSKHS